ncbi:MAG: DUF535 family protein, partial [Hyphomicrobiales bacterium]|nr:DUF535 family protein [Hyphomicrobiales bacterium]
MSNLALRTLLDTNTQRGRRSSSSLLLNHFLVTCRKKVKINTPPICRALAAARIIFFPRSVAKFYFMNVRSKLNDHTRYNDQLYFLAHNYYLSKRLTLRQRVQAAIDHHEYEFIHQNSEYEKVVYHAGGIVLWETLCHQHHFKLVLKVTEDYLHEGELSVTLFADDSRVCRMSFCYINANIFGLSNYITILITRNQMDKNVAQQVFNECFKQNRPQLFCLHAICGIALANEFNEILAIKHDAQIAYDENYDTSFRNSYTSLWETFDAAEIDEHVYRLG